MPAYTVHGHHYGTGEGSTYFLLYCYCTSSDQALKMFADRFGAYFSQVATVIEGFDFENNSARIIVSEKTRVFIEETKDKAHVYYSGHLHFNYG